MDREGMAIRAGELSGEGIKGESFEEIWQPGLSTMQTVSCQCMPGSS